MTLLIALLRDLKRSWFEYLRRGRLTRYLQDIDNYLTNFEIKRGLNDLYNRHVLVVSPHPDDETIGCGGTLSLLANDGFIIDVVYMTTGHCPEDNFTEKERTSEASKACKILGVTSTTYLGGQDGDLHLQPWIAQQLAELVSDKKYGTIFCPWAYDGNSDHMKTFHLVSDALANRKEAVQIWLYEVWSPLVANRVVDIDSTIETKKKAIRCYKTQLQMINYMDKFVSLAQYRSLICRPAKHAEAFYCTDVYNIRKMFKAKKRA